MPLNPAATEFGPTIPFTEHKLSLECTESPSSQALTPTSPHISNRKLKHHIYQDKRRAAMHTIVRSGYEVAKIAASEVDNVYDENVRDKLVVDLIRLLAGLGWGTSTVLRAVVLLEIDSARDAREALQQAKIDGQLLHTRKFSSDESSSGGFLKDQTEEVDFPVK